MWKKIKIAPRGLLRKLWECVLGVPKIDAEKIKNQMDRILVDRWLIFQRDRGPYNSSYVFTKLFYIIFIKKKIYRVLGLIL